MTRFATTLVVALVMVAAGLTQAGMAARAMTPQQIFSSASSGMVFVSSSCGSGAYTGSGFLVGPRLMVTARHVLVDADGTSCTATVDQEGTDAQANVSNWTGWYAVAKDDPSDFVVALLDRPLTGYSFRLATRTPSAGQRIVALGYSLGNALSLNQGRVVTQRVRSGVSVLQLNVLGGHGSSGGPIVDLNGFVVGLTQRGATDGSTSLVESLDLAHFIGGRPSSLCGGVAKGLTSTLCDGVKTPPQKSGGTTTTATPPAAPAQPPPPTAAAALGITDVWFATESSVDPAKKIFEVGAQLNHVYLIVRLNRITNASDPASIAVRIVKPDGTVYIDQAYPPQNSTPFQWWSLSLNLAGPGTTAPMGGAWTATVSVDGSQAQTFALNIVRLPNPFDFTLTPAASFNPAYTYSIHLNWSQKQEVPSSDTFTVELVSPSGAVKDRRTLLYANVLGNSTVFLTPGFCYSSVYTNTSTCEYGQWTVNVRRNDSVVWSAALQAGR